MPSGAIEAPGDVEGAGEDELVGPSDDPGVSA